MTARGICDDCDTWVSDEVAALGDCDDNDCANCGGEGFVYGCSWDWQCDTYDEGEGTCLCTRPCDWCSPRKPDPELRAVLAKVLSTPPSPALNEELSDVR